MVIKKWSFLKILKDSYMTRCNKNKWKTISIYFICPLTHITHKKKTDILIPKNKATAAAVISHLRISNNVELQEI